MFNLSLILILFLKSFVNTRPGSYLSSMSPRKCHIKTAILQLGILLKLLNYFNLLLQYYNTTPLQR